MVMTCFCNGAGDCYDESGQKDFCASGAINNFTSQLTKFQLQEENSTVLTKGLRYITYNFKKAHETECKCFS